MARDKIWILVLISLLLSLSCVLPSAKPKAGLVLSEEMDTVPGLPLSYRMVHHVRLEVRGRSFDFIGYLAVRGADWRAVAFSE